MDFDKIPKWLLALDNEPFQKFIKELAVDSKIDLETAKLIIN